jgi:hypothetical protein
MPIISLLLATLLLLSPRPAGAAEVRLRGGAVREGTVVALDDAGVHLEIVTGDVEVVSWDRVRQVTGPFAEAADDYASIADTAWRARYRLERGDPQMARPLFETLYRRYRGQTSQTALVVSEGVLRCRLQADVPKRELLEPYLETLRLRRSGIEQRAYQDLAPIIDSHTQLLMALPPLLVFGDAAEDAAPAAESMPASTDAVVQAIASLYGCALERASADADAPAPRLPVEHEGAALLHLLLVAEAGSDAARKSARQELRELSADADEPWLRAWRHAGLGVSLIRQSDAESRLEGILELLHVPLLYGELLPALAEAAAGAAASELADLGDLDQAARIRRDFSVNARHDTTTAPE